MQVSSLGLTDVLGANGDASIGAIRSAGTKDQPMLSGYSYPCKRG